MRFAASVLLTFLAFGSASAQSSVAARTNSIVASFNKSKHVAKERRGVVREKYKDIVSKADVRSNPAAYSGAYASDLGFSLDLRVANNGRVEGSGSEPLSDDPSVSRRFSLNGKVEGALLTATKTYANGRRENFEGVFIDLTSHDSPTDPGTTSFGLGARATMQLNGLTLERLFYERVR
jgi:hypothetical protein